jgi:hypothetical protein
MLNWNVPAFDDDEPRGTPTTCVLPVAGYTVPTGLSVRLSTPRGSFYVNAVCDPVQTLV